MNSFADEWYNLRDIIFDSAKITQEETISKFTQLDQLINQQISLLVMNTDYVEQYLITIYRQLATNQTRNRVLFNTNKSKRRLSIYRYDETKQLEYFSELYTYASYGKKKLFLHRLLSMPFLRLIYEEVICSYLVIADKYLEYARQATTLRSADKPSDIEYERCMMLMGEIENKILTEPSAAYGVINQVFTLYSKYQTIRNEIANPYLRIVYTVAKTNATNQAIFFDNFQNGTLGLLYAISAFSQAKNAIFSSYAGWWVRQQVLFEMKAEINSIRIPVSLWEAYTQIEKVRKHSVSEPSVKDIAKETGYSQEKIKNVVESVKISRPYSIQHYLDNEEKDGELCEVLFDTEFEQKQITTEHNFVINTWAKNLSHEERQVYALAHGYFDWVPEPKLSESDITHERLRQLAASTYLKLQKDRD